MIFSRYRSIENSYRIRFLEKIQEEGLNQKGLLWCVTEKVHGCIEENTIIETKEYRNLTIGKIVNEKIFCQVKSYNLETNEIEWKPVMNHSLQDDSENWFELELENEKKLFITGNHMIWVINENQWKKVEDLNGSEEFLVD